MDDTRKILTSLGLTATEAAIYLAGLGHAHVSVQEIGKETGIKRPTIYHALNTLTEKGLVAEKKIENRVRFSMCPPQQIKSYIDREKEKLAMRELEFEGVLPALEKLAAGKRGGKFDVVEYKGVEGVKTVFGIAFFCKSRHWDIIAPIDNFLREYEKEYARYYLKARKYNEITTRTLWEKKPGARKLSAEEIRERNPRFMPQAMQGKFKSMIILFDDKIAIIPPLEKRSAILIASDELHAMLNAMFEAIWSISGKYA